jgi:anthranilate synthase component 1
MVRQMERLAPAKEDKIGAPDALFVRPTVMIVFDTVRDEISIVTPARPKAGVAAKAAYEAALARLDKVVATLEAPLEHRDGGADVQLLAQEPVSNTPQSRFLEMVRRVGIHSRGDIFRSCCRSGSPRLSLCPPLRSIARCAA